MEIHPTWLIVLGLGFDRKYVNLGQFKIAE